MPRKTLGHLALHYRTKEEGPAAAKLLDLYTKALPDLKGQMRNVLLGRPATARAFLERVDHKTIAAAEVPVDQLRQVALHGDPKLDALINAAMA